MGQRNRPDRERGAARGLEWLIGMTGDIRIGRLEVKFRDSFKTNVSESTCQGRFR